MKTTTIILILLMSSLTLAGCATQITEKTETPQQTSSGIELNSHQISCNREALQQLRSVSNISNPSDEIIADSIRCLNENAYMQYEVKGKYFKPYAGGNGNQIYFYIMTGGMSMSGIGKFEACLIIDNQTVYSDSSGTNPAKCAWKSKLP